MNKPNSEIKSVGLIGAGTMGSAIAQHFLMKGMNVTLVDLDSSGLERGVSLINKSLEEALQRRIIKPDQKAEIQARLNTSTELKDLAKSQLCVEAIFEDFEVKQKLFLDLEKIVSDSCILATNTSTFSITDLASKLRRKDRFLGVHYFYHAAKNKLVEIIPGNETNPELTVNLEDFYSRIDKIPIIVGDSPGFAVNRFFVPWLNEGARLYGENHGSMKEIDEIACEAFNIGMGPFALMNATGVPIALHAANYLAEKFGPFYQPADALKTQVSTGKPWDLDEPSTGERSNKKIIRERLLGVTFGVAAQMVSEGVTDPTSTDLSALVGLKWSAGPFEMMNSLGISESTELVQKVFQSWDMTLPEIFSNLEGKGRFNLNYIKSAVIGETGLLEFNRPDRMNALDRDVVHQLTEKFSELENNPEVKNIVFYGSGKAFVAGADIKFFMDNIESDEIANIERFTNFGQELFKKIAKSPKRTIAYCDGLTLGGGAELALACDFRIGTDKTLLGFPETGIGIYPGLGGTQRLPRLIGVGLAKFMISTGKLLNAAAALKYGLIDIHIDRNKGMEEFISLDFENLRKKPEANLPEEIFSNFDGKISDEFFESEIFKKYEKTLRRKAPLALSKAMELIDEGQNLELDRALKLELDSLDWIFSTKDAKAGLGSVLYRKPPNFLGE